MNKALHKFLSAPLIKWGLFLFFSLLTIALIGPFFSPHSPYDIHLEYKNMAPSSRFWLGSDELGRDLFTRVCVGARISLSIAFTAAFIDLTIGVFWGSLAAKLGGSLEELMIRICDILKAVPYLLIVIMLTVIRGSGIGTILIAMSCTGWVHTAQIVRVQVSQIQTLDYMQSARAIGASSLYILTHYLIPNAIGPIIASATLSIPSAIFTEAFLSFLGLGIQAPDASLGVMISDGLGALRYYPWRLWIPSIAISLLLFSFHIIGNAARDALDPKGKK